MNTKTSWEFGTRQVVFGAIGAALYGALSYVTNSLFPLPAAGNVTFRPAVAVLIFFGVAYGPWVGLLAGFIGNTLGDALSGWGFYWNWSLGNGLQLQSPSRYHQSRIVGLRWRSCWYVGRITDRNVCRRY